MTMMTLSPIEQIAQSIEDNGDGWRFLWNPDDKGRRARLVSEHEEGRDIQVEISIECEQDVYYVLVRTQVRMRDGHWETVSASVRNPITRRALDEINRRLDGLEEVS